MQFCIYARCKKTVPEDAVYCPHCGRKQTRTRGKNSHTRARGTGSVYRLSGQRRQPYYAVLNGVSTGRTYATRQEAEAALSALGAVRTPELFRYSLEDCYHAWFAAAGRDMRTGTRRGYELAWRYLPKALRQKTAREVRTEDLQAVIDRMQRQGLSDSSANRVKYLYSKLCRWMMERDLIAVNYAAFLRVRRTSHRPARPFSLEEISAIHTLARQDPSLRLTQAAMLTMILLCTGMRISELFTLPVDRVHLDASVPYLQGGVKTKAGRDRVIPIHRTIRPFLRFFCARADGPLVLSGFDGNKTASGWRARDYAPMLAHLGIPYRVPHNTRKTLATRAAQSGVAPMALAKLMGWTDIAIGHRYYIEPEAAYLAAELEKLDVWLKDGSSSSC